MLPRLLPFFECPSIRTHSWRKGLATAVKGATSSGNLLVMFLDGFDCVAVLSERRNSKRGGFCSADRCHDRCAGIYSGRANPHFVSAWGLAGWSVNHQL